jgi:hypothetical protein
MNSVNTCRKAINDACYCHCLCLYHERYLRGVTTVTCIFSKNHIIIAMDDA